MAESEVARFRREQALAEQSMHYVQSGMAITARHDFITARLQDNTSKAADFEPQGEHMLPCGQLHKIHLQTAPLPQGSQALLRPASPPRPYVLVIDDSPTVRNIVEIGLRREGYEAHGCVDGLEAMQWLTTPGIRIPDLIVLDIGLPRMDGYEVARRLRSKPQFHKTVIVILTRRDGIVDRLKSRLAGAQVFMTKPFKVAELVAVIDMQLSGLPGNRRADA